MRSWRRPSTCLVLDLLPAAITTIMMASTPKRQRPRPAARRARRASENALVSAARPSVWCRVSARTSIIQVCAPRCGRGPIGNPPSPLPEPSRPEALERAGKQGISHLAHFSHYHVIMRKRV